MEVIFDYEVGLQFGTYQQAGSGSMTLELTESGTLENISSTTGHERIY